MDKSWYSFLLLGTLWNAFLTRVHSKHHDSSSGYALYIKWQWARESIKLAIHVSFAKALERASPCDGRISFCSRHTKALRSWESYMFPSGPLDYQPRPLHWSTTLYSSEKNLTVWNKPMARQEVCRNSSRKTPTVELVRKLKNNSRDPSCLLGNDALTLNPRQETAATFVGPLKMPEFYP